MTQTTKSEPELLRPPEFDEIESAAEEAAVRARRIAHLRMLWEKRGYLARVAIYGLLTATLIAFLIPKRYESTARLMPPDNQSASGLAMAAMLAGRTGGLGALAGDLLGLKSSSALFVGMLRSRTIEDNLINEFQLKKLYGTSRIEDARTTLEDRTRIAEDRKTGIVTITVTDRDPQRATSMARAYVQQLDRLVAEVSTSAARRERQFLEERLKSARVELDAAAKEFSEFASKYTAIDIPQQGKAMVEAAATLQGQLIAAQTELEGLKQIYTDNNVRVRAARARVNELQQSLERMIGTGASPTAGAGADRAALYPSIRELPQLGVPYSDRFRRAKIAEVVFELLTQQYELAKVQEAKEIPTVKVVDQPVVPEKKSFPPRLLLMAMGAAFSLACGVVWVLGSARWAEVEAQDPTKQFAQQVVSEIRASVMNGSQNGYSLRRLTGRMRGWLRRDNDQPGPRLNG